MYLTLLFISEPIIAANNRGENVGNLQTLQKITTRTGMRTVLSGVALKRAMRDGMQSLGADMWRRTMEPDNTNPVGYIYGTNNSVTMVGAEPPTPEGNDDSIFGWMIATKDKSEHATKRAGAVEVSAAISTTTYDNDTAFVQGLKATPNKSGLPELAPFSIERHWTRYQFLMTLNLGKLQDKEEALKYLLETLKSLQVGGSHSSNAAELTPSILAWRFHKTPGQGGLNITGSFTAVPDEDIDLGPLKARAENLGFDFEVAGMGQGTTVSQGLANILTQIREKLG